MHLSGTVILVHGLWMNGLVMQPLAGQLRRCGYVADIFSYPSLRNSIETNAMALRQHVRQSADGPVHLVGHSLGGLVILQALADDAGLIDGHVVLLGSPVNGSVVALRLQRWHWTRWLVGRGAGERLASGATGWSGHQPLGVIAGTLPVGVGQILGGLSGANDGTVTVAETRLAGCSDSLLVRTTHMGLLVSDDVAQAVCRFLQAGCFPSGV